MLRINNPHEKTEVDLPSLCRAFDEAEQLATTVGQGSNYLKWLRDQLELVLKDWGQDCDRTEAARLLRASAIWNWRTWLRKGQDKRPKGFPKVLLMALAEVTGIDASSSGSLRRTEINRTTMVTLNRMSVQRQRNEPLYDTVDCYRVFLGQLRVEPSTGSLEGLLEASWIRSKSAEDFVGLGEFSIWAQRVELVISDLNPGVPKPFVAEARKLELLKQQELTQSEDETPSEDSSINEPLETDKVLVTALNNGQHHESGSCQGGRFVWRDESRRWVLSTQRPSQAEPTPTASVDNLELCTMIMKRGTTANAKVFVRTEDIRTDFVFMDPKRLTTPSGTDTPEARELQVREQLIKQALKLDYTTTSVYESSVGVLYFE